MGPVTGLQMLASSLSSPSVSELRAWMPDLETIYADLTVLRAENETSATEFRTMTWPRSEESWWVGLSWSRFTAQHWEVALTAVTLYLIMIPSLKYVVAKYGKWDVKNFAFYWNAGLSIFSWCGVVACVPALVSAFFHHGLYVTCCAPAQWYSDGLSGFFVALFIYSKVAELVDTVLLLLAQKPVIALQWWHHSTVLLYCWHSYSASIGTGIWFAAMNYSVHAIMYGYFAVTATKFRHLVTPFAMFITLAQLLQMLVGMFVTVKAVMYQAGGQECHVNKTNSVLGLLMYFSYFILFLKLFIDNYCKKSKKAEKSLAKKQPSQLKLAHSASRSFARALSPTCGSPSHSESSDSAKLD